MPTISRLMLCAGLLWAAQMLHADGLPDAVTDADFAPVNLAEARLGQALFYDPILSGNRSVACATCHHPTLGTADGVSLSIGDGGIGLGKARRADPDNPPEKRIPRNAPGLFNLGAHEFTVMFHDGRLEADPTAPNGLRTPLDADMTTGFASVLSAQTMFPVLSRDEMAGSYNENPIGQAVRQGVVTGPGGAWDQLSRRVGDLPVYATEFAATYPHIDSGADIAFTDISNAIAAFIAFEWRSDTSPFDAALRGQAKQEPAAQRGQDLFYGAGGCAVCHAGPFLTDHGFHVMGDPQIGPGKAATFETHNRDDGRFRVTGREADRYAFRTPSLRNVALTGPYGHAGGHRDLAAYVAFHADPVAGLNRYDPAQTILADPTEADFAAYRDEISRSAIRDAVLQPAIKLSDAEVADLVAFLNSLTDPIAIAGRLGVPDAVPSGLAVPR